MIIVRYVVSVQDIGRRKGRMRKTKSKSAVSSRVA